MKTLKELRIGDTLFVYRPERKSTLEVRIEDIEEVVQGSSSVAIYFRVEDEGVYTVFIDPDYNPYIHVETLTGPDLSKTIRYISADPKPIKYYKWITMIT